MEDIMAKKGMSAAQAAVAAQADIEANKVGWNEVDEAEGRVAAAKGAKKKAKAELKAAKKAKKKETKDPVQPVALPKPEWLPFLPFLRGSGRGATHNYKVLQRCRALSRFMSDFTNILLLMIHLTKFYNYIW